MPISDWHGTKWEKTLTFTVTDALLSATGFAILSGAGLIQQETGTKIHYHVTTNTTCAASEIDLTDAIAPFGADAQICDTAPIYVIETEADGSITGTFLNDVTVDVTGKKLTGTFTPGKAVTVDYYVLVDGAGVDEIQIDAENFAGYFYVEADTLFRRQSDGVDLPCNITLPNVKIQSNFTFSMASTGDPSTFDFTMDAFPGVTYFNPGRQVLCAMQVLNDYNAGADAIESVFLHDDDEVIAEAEDDSADGAGG